MNYNIPVKNEVLDFDSVSVRENCNYQDLQNVDVLQSQDQTKIVDFLEHCVLCLRKLSDDLKDDGESGLGSKRKRGGWPRHEDRIVMEAALPSTLNSFNHLWPYLNDKWKMNVGESTTANIKFARKKCKDGLSKLSEIPPICEVCGGKIKELDKLHQKITDKVGEIKEIIVDSSPFGTFGSRSLMFQELLKREADQLSLTNTKQFLNDLGTGCGLLTEYSDDNISNSAELPDDDQSGSVDLLCNASTSTQDQEAEAETLQSELAIKPAMDVAIAARNFANGCEKRRRGRPRKGEVVKIKIFKRKRPRPRLPKGLKSHRCDICDKNLPYTELQDHLRTHVQDYFVTCPNPNCGYACSNPVRLEKIHLRMTRNARCAEAAGGKQRHVRICEVCGLKTIRLNVYKGHVASHETSEKLFPCPIEGCSRSFTVRPSVSLHLETHSKSPEKQHCELCRKYLNVKDVEEHLKGVHNIVDVVRCPECPFVFKERENMVLHMEWLHNFERSGLQCDICKDGVKHQMLRAHYIDTHKIGSRVTCEYCSKSFLKISTLKQHQQKLHGVSTIEKTEEKGETNMKIRSTFKYKCDKCKDPLEFKNYPLFLKHSVDFHQAKPFPCSLCEMVFLSRSDWCKHQKKVHDPNFLPQHKCKIDGCGKIFLWPKTLRQHMKRNHDPNLDPAGYPCDICGSSLKSLDGLYKHKRIIHEQKEAAVCESCGKCFSRKSNLALHMLIHNGEKPHQCEICGMGFRQKSVLKTHKKIHENV